jgi:hypothetical protein
MMERQGMYGDESNWIDGNFRLGKPGYKYTITDFKTPVTIPTKSVLSWKPNQPVDWKNSNIYKSIIPAAGIYSLLNRNQE